MWIDARTDMKFISLVALLFTLVPAGGDALADAGRAGLFDDTAVMELSLQIDLDNLCRPREDPDCGYEPSRMGWKEDGKEQTLPVEYIVRGGWRSLSANCQVPLLFIRFNEEDTRGTPFEGETSLPLTTHCGRTSIQDDLGVLLPNANYEQYLLKEYLAYRMFEEISGLSLRVRLVRVRYEEPGRPGKGPRNYAFFTEHFKSLAARSDTVLLPRDSFDHERLDLRQADRIALYQFMIGNTDWSIARQRNIILLQGKDGTQSPVPYDLDMSGLVDAPYAGPPPSLPIDEVTDRYYLGYCHPGTDWNALFDEFRSSKNAIHALIPNVPGLQGKQKSAVNRFIDRFFRILNSPERRDREIIGACQPWPPSKEDHMDPANLSR
jgi:hypothetical protein